MERIVELRGMALDAAEAAAKRGDHATVRKLKANEGARHVTHFTDSVARSGTLDETRLPMEVMGVAPDQMLNDLFTLNWGDLAGSVAKGLNQAPTALKMLSKGKLAMPYFMHHNVDDVEEVRRIHKAVDEVKASAAKQQVADEAQALEDWLEEKKKAAARHASS